MHQLSPKDKAFFKTNGDLIRHNLLTEAQIGRHRWK
jgi:hypothetical protein